MTEQIIVGLIAALMGAVAFVVDYRWSAKSCKEESKMNDKIHSDLDELSEALAKLGRATSFDGPIGADTLTAIYNPDTMITAIEPAREDDKPLVARVCPNCGAPVHGDECEYCGSVFAKGTSVTHKRDYGDGERRVRIYDPDAQQWVWVSENPMTAVKTSKVLTTMRWS